MNQSAISSPANTLLYVNKVPLSGWLNVRLRSGLEVPLLAYTTVKMLETAQGRTWFTVQDGGQKGAVASLSDANAKIYLGKKAPLKTGVMMVVKYGELKAIASKPKRTTLTQQTGSVSLNGIQATATLNTKLPPPDHLYTPLPPGIYKIKVPLHPHKKT